MTTAPPRVSQPQPRWADPTVMRALFEQSPFSSVIYDAEGHPIALNAAFERLWGVGIETVPPDYSVLQDPELERNGLLPFIRRAFAGETVTTPPARYDISRVSGTGTGRAVWTTGHFFPIRDASGALRNVVLVHVDVTDRQEAEEALRRSEERIRLAQAAAHIGVFDWEIQTGRVTWSEEEQRIFGIEPGTFEGTIEGWARRVVAEDREAMERDIQAHMARGDREMTFAFRIIRPDGEIRRIEGRAAFVYGADGSAVRMVGVNIDVTDRHRLDAALRDSEERYRATFDEAPVGIAQVGLDGRIIALNPTLERLLGRTRAELLGVSWEELTHPDDLPRERELAERLMSGASPAATIEKRYLRPDGTVVWARVTGTLVRADDGSPRYVTAVVEDLSERDAARRALDETERRTRALLESVTDPLVAYDSDWRIIYLNEPARAVFRGYGFTAEPLNRVVWDIVPSLPGSDVHAAMLSAMAAGEPRTLEVRQMSGGWLEIRTYPMAGGLVAYWTDVTERHRGRERTELLAAAGAALTENVQMDAALLALMHTVARSYADYVSVHLAEPGGGVRLVDVVHRDSARAALARETALSHSAIADVLIGVSDVVRSGQSSLQRDLPWDRAKAAARDGGEITALERLAPVSSIAAPLHARGRVIGALTLVAAESRRRFDERDLELVEELARRAALAVDNARLFAEAERARQAAEDANRAKTQFLATMSHELRTPLNAISGYASLMEMGVRGPVSDAQRADLERIQRSQRHLTTIINEILDYARLETGAVSLQREPTDIAGAVAAATSFIEPQRLARGITLESRIPAGTPAALADVEKLQQILLNLLSNALKFTPLGGTITVESRASIERPGMVELSVRDTGVGIPPDKLDVIFEPFVQVGRALNNPGEGTGLGLAISRDLARAMGGDLVAQSTPGDGSTFTLTLPTA